MRGGGREGQGGRGSRRRSVASKLGREEVGG